MAKYRDIILLTLITYSYIREGLSIKYFTINETQDKITERCIVDILSSRTQFNSVLFVVNNYRLPTELLRDIHSLNNVKVCVKDYNISLKVKPSTYLIYAPNKKFEDLIDSIDRDWYREPEALYIVRVRDISKDDIGIIFRVLWEYHLIHVLVIINDTNDNAAIYTYFPYNKGQCGRDHNNIVKLGNCTSVKEFDIIEKLREYDKPRLKNCTLNVATRKYPPLVFCNPHIADKRTVGIERFLVEQLLESENITLNYTCLPENEDVGSISDNFTASGVMEMLYENEVDMIFGGFSVNNRRSVFFDYICVHLAYEDAFFPVTHSSDFMDRWRIVYVIFHNNVWFLLLLTFVLCAILLSDFSNTWKINRINRNTSELLNLFGNATQNITLPLREQLFKNCVIIHWLWFIFLITSFYQTILTSFTTYRMYKPQLNEYLSLWSNNVTPCIPWDVLLFLKNSGQVPIINIEYADRENCETAGLALDKVAKQNNKYTVTMYLQYLWWVRNHPDKKEQINLMKETFYNNLYGVFFKRGFPLIRNFSAKMMRLPQHGFVNAAKVIHGITGELERRNNIAFAHIPLKLYDLIVPFSILTSGLILALIVFIVELLHKTKGDE